MGEGWYLEGCRNGTMCCVRSAELFKWLSNIVVFGDLPMLDFQEWSTVCGKDWSGSVARYVYYGILRYAVAPFLESSIIIWPEFFHYLSGIGKPLGQSLSLTFRFFSLLLVCSPLSQHLQYSLHWSLLLLHGDKLWWSWERVGGELQSSCLGATMIMFA